MERHKYFKATVAFFPYKFTTKRVVNLSAKNIAKEGMVIMNGHS